MYGTLWTWNVSASKYIRTVCVDKMLVHYETRSIVCYTTTWYTYRAYTPWSHVSMVRWDMIRRMCATIYPSCHCFLFLFFSFGRGMLVYTSINRSADHFDHTTICYSVDKYLYSVCVPRRSAFWLKRSTVMIWLQLFAFSFFWPRSACWSAKRWRL